MIALYVLKKAIFSDIVRYTGQPKSSVYQSLQILEDEGLVMVRYAITFKGPRKVIEITSKGEYLVERLLELASRLRTGGVA